MSNPVATAAPPRILLADDEETFLLATAEQLRLEGYETTTRTTAEDVIAALAESDFDLVVSDVRMADMSGLQLAERLREMGTAPPLILVTAYPSLKTAVPALHLSVAAYLIKPLDFEAFLSHVRTAIEQGRLSRALRELQESTRIWTERVAEAVALMQRLGATATTATLEGAVNMNLADIMASLENIRRLAGDVPSIGQRSAAALVQARCRWHEELVAELSQVVDLLGRERLPSAEALEGMRARLVELLRSRS